MQKKKYLIIAILMPFMVMSQGTDKTLSFDLIHKGKVIGTLIATQKNNGGTEEYFVKAELLKKVLHVKHCTYDLALSYENDELQASDYELYVNNKMDKSAKINKSGGGLSATKNNKSVDIREKSITYSSALLYFKEPVGISRTFSEPNLKFRKLEPHKSKEHTYVLDKNKGEYYYENGELQRMVYDDVVKVELVRKK